MSSQDDARLIHEVRKYPNIYDSRTPIYKDPAGKENSWYKIGYKLGIKPQDAKGRWRNLRDRFVREKKRLVTEGEAAYSQRDPWPLLDDMSFLWDFIIHRQERRPKLVTNVKRVKISKQNTEGVQQALQPLTKSSPEWVQVSWDYDTPADSPSPGDISLPADSCIVMDGNKIKRDSNETVEDELDFEDEAEMSSKTKHTFEETETHSVQQEESSMEAPFFSASESNPQQFPESTRDEDELFCLSVAGSLKRFSPKKKALAKLWIQQVMFEVEFQSSITKEIAGEFFSS